MEVAAVLRVKRKRAADPAEALVLTCKRLRHETEAEPVQLLGPVETTTFKFAGTVSTQSEPFQKYIQDAICRDKVAQTLRPSLGSNQRIRKNLRVSKHTIRHENRYHLITSRRSSYADGDAAELSTSEVDSTGSTKSDSTIKKEALEIEGIGSAEGNLENSEAFQLFDIIHEEADTSLSGSAENSSGKSDDPDVVLCNSVRLIRKQLTLAETSQGEQHHEKSDDYVYDIYYMETSTQGWIQDIISVKPYAQECELVDDHKSQEIYEDEDDENEENNWRNEYPDEDEFLFEEEEEENSDNDERNKDINSENSEDEGIHGTSWNKYHRSVLQEFGYDEMRDLDSD
ncbi:probable RNA polymerase II nuclear localization protein SLC7A6OS [Rhinatrema bivittatum]|uniref:probable RNA polymerase II nuclear localization protein SLC7A6OS n=1 Tax=Rhinatrema bivittatum TaxID=194408 RepID=UPI00112BAFBD|nr:probable RNA polymerase II nuclear localization protein SLC7A6OS [Rhinatrema bivittatum]